MGEESGDEREMELIEECAVESEEMAFSALGIAGEFFVVVDEICGAHDLDAVVRAEVLVECLGDLLHNELVCLGDRGELRMGMDGENELIIEATWALEDSATTAESPEYGDILIEAIAGMDFGLGIIGEAEDDEMRWGFPGSENTIRGMACFRPIEEGFIECEIQLRGF